jgi:hypothetical protein
MIKRSLVLWFSIATWSALSLIMPALAQTEPAESFPVPPHRSVYEVLRNGSKIGEVHAQLSRDERGVWFFDTDTVATATLARMLRLSAEESAHFIWREGRILPLTYRNVSREALRTRYWQHQLDWTAGLSRAQTHEGDLEIELETALLDPLTLRLQTAALLALDDDVRDDLRFRVIERDRIEDQRMEFQGLERIESALGCFDTQRWYRFRREGSSRNYRMWVAEALHWMPLRIDLGDEDHSISLRLTETDLIDTPVGCE